MLLHEPRMGASTFSACSSSPEEPPYFALYPRTTAVVASKLQHTIPLPRLLGQHPRDPVLVLIIPQEKGSNKVEETPPSSGDRRKTHIDTQTDIEPP